MDVEASADPKKPRLEPEHSGEEESTTQAATDLEQTVSVESESPGLLLQDVTTLTTLPYGISDSDEDGDSSSSGEDEEEEEEEEEEGSDMRIQVWKRQT